MNTTDKTLFQTFLETPLGEENALAIVRTFIQRCRFDNFLESFILSEISSYCKYSQTGRDVCVALLARVSSSPKFARKFVWDVKYCGYPLTFSLGREFSCESNIIHIRRDEEVELYRSVFGSGQSKGATKDGCFLYPLSFSLFHEMGHSASSDFVIAADQSLIDDSFNAASRFFTLEIDVSNYQRKMDELCDNASQMETSEQKQYCDKMNWLYPYLLPGNIFARAEQMKVLAETPEGRMRLVWHGSCEIWQILGIACLPSDEGKTLYINKLCDTALFAKLGKPLCCDHCDQPKTADGADSYHVLNFVTSYRQNDEAYRALLGVFDVDYDDYLRRLRSGAKGMGGE
jgi:hypothetical protein